MFSLCFSTILQRTAEAETIVWCEPILSYFGRGAKHRMYWSKFIASHQITLFAITQRKIVYKYFRKGISYFSGTYPVLMPWQLKLRNIAVSVSKICVRSIVKSIGTSNNSRALPMCRTTTTRINCVGTDPIQGSRVQKAS